jgi:ATP diphosphatase
MDKLCEEMDELRAAEDADHRFEEFGDLLFVMANLARHMQIDPEAALRAANAKFTRRFKYIEAELAARGKAPAESDLTEMDALWEAAKARERAG